MTNWTPTPGNCYEDAVMVAREKEGFLIVHGFPTLTRGSGQAPAGSQYGHAWLEKGDIVYDPLADKEIPKVLYYAFGQIDKEDVRKYNVREAVEMMLDFEHFGPWHEGPEGAF